MSSNKSRSVVGIFILIFVLFFVFLIFSFVTVSTLKNSTTDNSSNDIFGSENSKKPIAVVEVNGAIMKSDEIIERLMIAEKDESVKGIILRIDSPGGAVGPTQEIYEEIVRIDKEKPVYASFGSVAASGGYYLGAAARKIYSNPGTITGSIGVIMKFMNFEKLYEFAKVKQNTIKAGKYKDIGASNREMKPGERQLLDEMVLGVHDQFISDINKRRKDRIKGDLKEHAQGQIFSGADALKHGLVDGLGGLWKTGRILHKELKLKEEFGMKFIQKKKKFKLNSFLERIDSIFSKVSVMAKNSGLPMFLYSPQKD